MSTASCTVGELSKIYYRLVGFDHHKDKDCHFSIEKRWSYGELKIVCYHNGYVNELTEVEFNAKDYRAMEKAERYLVKVLFDWCWKEVKHYFRAHREKDSWSTPPSKDKLDEICKTLKKLAVSARANGDLEYNEQHKS